MISRTGSPSFILCIFDLNSKYCEPEIHEVPLALPPWMRLVLRPPPLTTPSCMCWKVDPPLPQVEGEVKLPRAAAILRQLSLLVGEGQPKLDHLEHVHVAPSPPRRDQTADEGREKQKLRGERERERETGGKARGKRRSLACFCVWCPAYGQTRRSAQRWEFFVVKSHKTHTGLCSVLRE